MKRLSRGDVRAPVVAFNGATGAVRDDIECAIDAHEVPRACLGAARAADPRPTVRS